MKIILGITGSVATVLAPKLALELINAGHEIRIVATTPALYFLPPGLFDEKDLTLKCGDHLVDVFIDKTEWPSGGYHKNDPVKHINFRDWAQICLIAPLSANTLAKLANGLADNFLSCIARAWPKEKPFIIAPAMNTEMWLDPITSQHIQSIEKRYHKLVLVNPIKKVLACGDDGMGAMAEIDKIVSAINAAADVNTAAD